MSSISRTRLNKEYEGMMKDPPENFIASPVKDDMFCWHFTIRGPDDSDFEGGLYHGVIKLPTAYPTKPPSVMFLTPNGRFDTNIDICLSMTKYHKEEWQAAWTIRSMLEAIIAFMPVKEDHEAIGAVDYPTEARKKYASLSVKYKCDICGPLINILPEKPKKSPVAKKDDKDKDKDDEEQTHSIHSASSKNKKKIDQMQRIKGVIVEDSHEDDIDEENKLRKNSQHQTNTATAIDKDNKVSIPNPKKVTSKETVDFSDYFKKSQQLKYEKESIKEQPKANSSQAKSISPLKSNDNNDEIIIDNNNQPHQNIPIKQSNIPSNNNQPNKLTQLIEEELEFHQLMNSIKSYNTKNNEEIQSILTKDHIEKTKDTIKSKSKLLDNYQLSLLLQNNTEIENLLKKQINGMKLISKSEYENERNKRLRLMNYILILSLIIIFGYFWGVRKFL